MGVVFAKPGKKDRIIAVTRGPEAEDILDEVEEGTVSDAENDGQSVDSDQSEATQDGQSAETQSADEGDGHQ